MDKKSIGLNGFKNKLFVGDIEPFAKSLENQEEINFDDFLRCIVRYCSESVEFIVDDMKFKVTCERIE